ncbi:glycosyltransferase [Donghicola mangrovi]|nr:glycosyltransferase [Donghicola mangrovi]
MKSTPADLLTEMATPVAAKRLVAVVVTYNRLTKLKVTLARLLESPAQELAAVVVINNASTDGTGDWLDAFAAETLSQGETRLDIINSAVNTGGAGGFATGMRRAMEHHSPDWLVVMDDDGRPEQGALNRFQTIPDSKWDAIAAAVYFPDGQICEMNRPSRNPFWHGKEFLRTALKGRSGFHLKSTHYEGDAIGIDVTSFVGFFVSARAVKANGYPDPDLFIYGDDGIYTIELTQAGHSIGFEPQIRFEHDMATFKVGDDNGAQRGRFVPLWKVYYYHRNLLMLYRIAAGPWFWLAMMAIIPKWLLKTRAHQGEQKVFLRLLILAIRDGLAGRRHRDHAEIMKIASGSR